MNVLIIAYALVGAIVFGWLLRQHMVARHRSEDVPLHVLVFGPLVWLPVLLCGVALVAFAIAANAWRNWRQA